ncbi:MAG: NAD+ synthase [Nitrosopumilus sp. H8]|nr:MAG: NAD+ synthase [Nitrosopumilus sp. H13]RNJ80211.1 MAG: NAD+ synthase [Nitrosopumilus sp. H8]
MNQEIIAEITGQDYEATAREISRSISESLEQSGSRGVIFGMSGGIDSAVLAYICSTFAKERTLALIMPDTSVTPEEETHDALQMISMTGLEHKLIDIKPIVSEYTMFVEPDEHARGNLRARVRANLLYYYANIRGLLVLGSSDKSELQIGYFTKFGDGASDLAPISSLYKLQTRGIARHLGVPDRIISKKSSPHLWPDHDAEGEIGMSYEEVDSILYCKNEKKMTQTETASMSGIDGQKVSRVWQMCADSKHKRGTGK